MNMSQPTNGKNVTTISQPSLGPNGQRPPGTAFQPPGPPKKVTCAAGRTMPKIKTVQAINWSKDIAGSRPGCVGFPVNLNLTDRP